LAPSQATSHELEALHVTPAAHDAPLKHLVVQSTPPHTTPPF
jgi:hypothetical protein